MAKDNYTRALEAELAALEALIAKQDELIARAKAALGLAE